MVWAVFPVLLLCVTRAGEATQPRDNLHAEAFQSFTREYQREYISEVERSYRRSVFGQNWEYIQKRNAELGRDVLGVTIFADVTHDEFVSRFFPGLDAEESDFGAAARRFRKANEAYADWSTSHVQQPQSSHAATDGRDMELNVFQDHEVGNNLNDLTTTETFAKHPQASYPDEVDWESLGYVTSVKDQAKCGSCWAFSAVGAIEAALKMSSGELHNLSTQQLVDCDKRNSGCSGGLMDTAYEYVMMNGVASWTGYPYKAKQGKCQAAKVKPVTKLQGYYNVESMSWEAFVVALAKQPLAVAINADSDDFQHYKTGVLPPESCSLSLNHGVLATGYSLTDATPYIRIKNSWGVKWGEAGYVKLELVGGASSAGTCGVYSLPSYPFVSLD